ETSRASRTRPGPKCLVVSIDPDEAAARQPLEVLGRAQRRGEAVAGVAGVLAGHGLGPRALAQLDRLEDGPVLGLGDVEAAIRLGVAGVEADEPAIEHRLAQAQRRAQPLRQLRRGPAHRRPSRSASASVASTRVVVPYS